MKIGKHHFTGIAFMPFEITLNNFDGYGITVLNFSWNVRKVVTITNGFTCFSFRFAFDYENYGRTPYVFINLFGLKGKVWEGATIAPKGVCKNCGEVYGRREWADQLCDWCRP